MWGMDKVSIFRDTNMYDLEDSINDFLQNVKLIDVKFSVAIDGKYTWYYAMVIYREV